ncbi:DUF4382 domain-containing protein [Colwellia sp. BRX10-3]|uniref:DUF4382 domain-containing protein n=1 Tax=Colwellia sp. BRX10-3 TaxID=2759844 RepID=UPI0015F37C40|nr:DUF4382 domain-containing protein [Colwellia sp. BRX10-3]MBA6389629.1 DUF4382 domain-containing protein [Colwellia sp. BRX10-3]
MLNKKHILALSIPLLLLTACGGSDSSSNDETPLPSFSLAVSDAPVDDLSEVVVCFNQIELKGDTDITFTVGNESGMIASNDSCLNNNNEIIPDTVGIDLLAYTGSDSITLVDGISIAAGDYTQMRLIMSDGSYGIDALSGEKISVSVPSNELKLDGFTATLGGTVDFTLEFDLNKAMTNPVGQAGYFLKPRGVRLVNNNEAGHIEGSVSETLLINNQCTPLSDPSLSIASIYLYEGPDLAMDTLADVDGVETNQPLASTSVTFDSEQTAYNFEIGFVNAGDYTIAFSCDTEDSPEVDDEVTFISAQNVNVVAGNTAAQVSFEAQ